MHQPPLNAKQTPPVTSQEFCSSAEIASSTVFRNGVCIGDLCPSFLWRTAAQCRVSPLDPLPNIKMVRIAHRVGIADDGILVNVDIEFDHWIFLDILSESTPYLKGVVLIPLCG
jgi:hypothetical protein